MSESHSRSPANPAHTESARWKAEQRRCPVLFRHPGDSGGFLAAIGVDAANQRDTIPDFLAGLIKHPTLFVERAGMHFRCVGVDRDGADAFGPRDKRQVAAGF